MTLVVSAFYFFVVLMPKGPPALFTFPTHDSCVERRGKVVEILQKRFSPKALQDVYVSNCSPHPVVPTDPRIKQL